MSEGGPLDEGLTRLREAIEAARSIGLEPEAAAAEEVAGRIASRAGFGGAVYVMALAGGTGVGKSSILNALAGEEVSEARALRPTTDRPVAWVADDRRADLKPLLQWLGIDRVATHDGEEISDVALLDLPDVDSVRTEHRATVDALLPRIDSVAWVIDPEKYDDERAHAYWRTLAPHAERLRFILNKADRLTDAAREAVANDLRSRLMAAGIPRPLIHVVSAATGDGIDRLRDELSEAGHAKVIVATKLETDRADAAAGLAGAVGIDPEVGYRPLLSDERRATAERDVVAGALTLIDPPGLARQVRSAVLHRARAGGGSFLGRAIAMAASLTGQRRRGADPAAYLRDWRSRGAMGRMLNPLRTALVEAASSVPAPTRGRLLEALGGLTTDSELARVLDRAAAVPVVIPSSRIWPIVGALQMAVGGVLIFAVAWIVVLFVAGAAVPVSMVDAPFVGPIPMPLALLTGSLLASALLGWLLGLHAGWIGRRVAAEVGDRTTAAVRQSTLRDAFEGLRRVEDARRTIAAAR